MYFFYVQKLAHSTDPQQYAMNGLNNNHIDASVTSTINDTGINDTDHNARYLNDNGINDTGNYNTGINDTDHTARYLNDNGIHDTDHTARYLTKSLDLSCLDASVIAEALDATSIANNSMSNGNLLDASTLLLNKSNLLDATSYLDKTNHHGSNNILDASTYPNGGNGNILDASTVHLNQVNKF